MPDPARANDPLEEPPVPQQRRIAVDSPGVALPVRTAEAGGPGGGRGAGGANGASIPSPISPAGAETPLRATWRRFRRHRLGFAGLMLLVILYLITIFADFIAPYDYDNETRDLFWSPPTHLHFSDAQGRSWRPFIYPVHSYIDDDFNIRHDEDTHIRCYLRWFVRGDKHTFLGIPGFTTTVRLFGFDGIAATTGDDQYYVRYYMMGSDLTGRDIFSRICYGARISMTIGLIGESIVLIIGGLVGGISGYFGGTTDNLLQRLCEVLMLLPGFYLLLMLRFCFPADMSSVKVYFGVIIILSLVSWPGLARIVRGMVLSIRGLDYVQSARAIGQNNFKIIVRHVLPGTFGFLIVSITMGIPGYILGESGLSVLGLGIMEPIPSWGNMLQQALDISELDLHPWVLIPGVFILLATMAFNLVGDGLRDALDPKGQP